MLERYVKSTTWNPHYASITVFNGREDAADVYYPWIKWTMAASDVRVSLDDTNEWKLDAYDGIPDTRFRTP